MLQIQLYIFCIGDHFDFALKIDNIIMTTTVSQVASHVVNQH